MPSTAEKLSVKEKVGYALGDTAANLIFQTMVMFQLAFYTDTFGITAAAAGTLLVVVRVWDAVFDPVMGVLADRTKTRWGKVRPWILWTAVPFGVMGFLAFVTPDHTSGGKLIYAYCTYIVLMMVYSANNLPYSALSGVITGDLGERTSLSSYRFVFAMIAQLIIQGLALPMVSYFGAGNSARGYRFTMGIFSALVFALKAGLGFGGALTGYVLSLYGYVPNAVQSASALNGIVMTMSIFPAITFGLCVVCLFFYGIDREAEVRITGELTERRKGFAVQNS